MNAERTIATAIEYARANEFADSARFHLRKALKPCAAWITDEEREMIEKTLLLLDEIRKATMASECEKYIAAEERKEERGAGE